MDVVLAAGEAPWEAAMRVERLPQSINADVLHLFSIGEGIAYGSSTMNFFISGAHPSRCSMWSVLKKSASVENSSPAQMYQPLDPVVGGCLRPLTGSMPSTNI